MLNHGFVHSCVAHLNHYAMSADQMRRKGELLLKEILEARRFKALRPTDRIGREVGKPDIWPG